jgi:conjugal transfer ATP-binding protein TraC
MFDFKNSTQGQKLSDIIHLDSFEANNNIIVTKPRGDSDYLGCTYLMTPLSGAGQEVTTLMASVIKTAPDESIIQVSLLCEPDMWAQTDYLRGKTHGGHFIQELIQRRADLLKKGLSADWQIDLPIINKKSLIISLLYPVKNVDQEAMERATIIQDDFLVNLRASGFNDAARLAPHEILSLYSKFANPYSPKQDIQLDDMVELKYQAFGPETKLDFTVNELSSVGDETYCSTIAIKSYPPTAAQGLMNLVIGAPFNEGETLSGGGQRIMTPFVITTTIRVAAQERELRRISKSLKSRQALLPKWIETWKFSNEAVTEKMHDLNYLSTQCGPEGDKLVFVSTTIFVFGKNRKATIDSAMGVKSTLNKLRFDARLAGSNAMVRWAQSLPLNFSNAIAKDLDSESLMPSVCAGCLIPIYSDFAGNGANSVDAGSMFYSRRGSTYFLDPFKTNNNYSGIIVAQSGSGKSFLIQQFATDQLAQGTQVFILDNGRSTEKLTRAVGGQFIEFSGDEKHMIGLNPFTGLSDAEFAQDSATITKLFLLMANAKEDDKDALLVMDAAVKLARSNSVEPEIETVIQALRTSATSKPAAEAGPIEHKSQELYAQLQFFMNDPYKSSFFKGKSDFDKSNNLTVFELGQLNEHPHLKNVVMFFILHILNNKIKKTRGKKLVIADEAHDLLDDPMSASVLTGIYQKGRKDGVSMWIVIQSLLKLFETPTGRFIYSQSAWRLILSQKKEEIDRLFEEKLLTQYADDPYFKKLISSIKTLKPVFSEVLIIGEQGYDAVRLYVDKFTSTLFNSEQGQRDAFFDRFNSMSPLESVIDIIDEFISDKSRIQRHVVSDAIYLLKSSGMNMNEITELVRDELAI